MTDSKIEIPLKDKINLDTAAISWKELEVFFAKGNLLVASPKQDLVCVAEIIASNNHKELEKLITANQIQFATVEWVKENCVSNPMLWAVVIAPYVVCQLKAS